MFFESACNRTGGKSMKQIKIEPACRDPWQKNG